MSGSDGYEAVIGLEVHIELNTKTKIFCACPTAFGAPPNTQVCPVCMGLPGALPVLNQAVVESAVRAGLALGCKISRVSRLDRKNYYYPDLPKAYQISQFDRPLCGRGSLEIETSRGVKRVGITRIHIEEDAGKLIHGARGTLIDCNRCGVPLIEVVSEPDLRSAEEADAYLRALRAVMRYIGVSDCRMNEGSMRCDVNLSVHKKGEAALGVRTEMKNINSFRYAAAAIEYEFRRQVQTLLSGGTVVRETRRFDPATGKTHTLRVKESEDDYRFFPEPDLPEIALTDGDIDAIRRTLPELPAARKKRLETEYGLPGKDAALICAEKTAADWFEAAARRTAYPAAAANLTVGELFRRCAADDFACPIPPENMAALCDLFGGGTVNSTTAKALLARMWDEGIDPARTVENENLAVLRDPGTLRREIERAVKENPKCAEDYQKGKTAAAKTIVGAVMK
ncbi:MAG: Asp-tRNA(Asn)/Glu-tRNA(Gln) amidotransferase subunit GatB, partial [Clostridia bacterium]|nr:Asp-tRNA(Asn)/Glu-tRNA(Gln) amidotransferase subunit GatB [Clostridia bacterium]